MKALSLLLLRISTGALLIIWGWFRVKNPANPLADTFYNGILSGETAQMGIGIAEMVLGGLVILGLLRIIVYPLQAIILGLGAAFIWKHFADLLLDPIGIHLFEEGTRANQLFFPSTTVFIATLVLLVFKEYDSLSLDKIFRR